MTRDALMFFVYDGDRTGFVRAKHIPLENVQEALNSTKFADTRLVIVHTNGVDSFNLVGEQKLVGNEADFDAMEQVIDAVESR